MRVCVCAGARGEMIRGAEAAMVQLATKPVKVVEPAAVPLLCRASARLIAKLADRPVRGLAVKFVRASCRR